jgi:hypothetical protein
MLDTIAPAGDPRRLRVLGRHVHGTWHDAFVRGGHEFLLPVLTEGGERGGRAGRPWPPNVDVTDADRLTWGCAPPPPPAGRERRAT